MEVKLFTGQNGQIPVYQTEGAAGADIYSAERAILAPGDTAIIGTDLRVEIPRGFEIQIRPRSGLAAKNSITVLNAPGTIDCDFRGEIKIILHNAGRTFFDVKKGDRIAQMVLAPVVRAVFSTVTQEELKRSERGEGGFGSTGSS